MKSATIIFLFGMSLICLLSGVKSETVSESLTKAMEDYTGTGTSMDWNLVMNYCSKCGDRCKFKCGTRKFRSCCYRIFRKRTARTYPDLRLMPPTFEV